MKKIILRKVEELKDAFHKGNIDIGFKKEGNELVPPTLGEAYWVGNAWRTSPVIEIISPTKFKTMNSIYEIEYI